MYLQIKRDLKFENTAIFYKEIVCDIKQAVIYYTIAIFSITYNTRSNISIKLGVLTIIAVLVVSINICSVLMMLSIIFEKRKTSDYKCYR